MKKKLALAAPFVISVSAACSKDPKPEPFVSHNPPATNDVPTASAPVPSASAEPQLVIATNPPARPQLSDYPKLVNPKDPEGRAIFLSDGAKCYVELPFGPLKPGQTRVPGTAPKHKDVTCPKELAGPAWEACKGGSIQSDDAGTSCICFHMGNPPPLPRSIACP